MLVARVLDPQPGETVLDLCAAPGAKTTHIAALMRGRGRLVAVERNAGRCDSLQANCRRMGAHTGPQTAPFSHRTGEHLLGLPGRCCRALPLAKLDRLLVDVATGRERRLLVTMPPRHGKSMLVSHYFPAWYLGVQPHKRVMLASYAGDFAAS